MSGSSLSFSGTDANWTGTIHYDATTADFGGADGVLQEMRIVCDYSMPDGSTGTLYSTDCGSIWSYIGDYLKPVSAELRDGTIEAKFTVDTSLVQDLSKLTPTELVLWSGAAKYDLLGAAEIAGPGEDGAVTVRYTLSGESLNTLVYNDVVLAMNYTDMGGAIDWRSEALVQFDPHTAPTFSLYLGGFVEPGAYEPGCGVSCDIKLNSLLGGQAFITMQKLGSGGWETDTVFGTLEYSAGDEDEHGILNFFYVDPELDDLWGNDYVGRRYKARFVIDYIYPDGNTGRLESAVFEQYGGGFAHYVNSPPISYDAENKLLTAEIAIDLSLVEPENITVITTKAHYAGSLLSERPSLRSSFMGSDGMLHQIYAVPLEDFVPGGEYWYDIGLRYYNGTGPRWEQEVFTYCNVDG